MRDARRTAARWPGSRRGKALAVAGLATLVAAATACALAATAAGGATGSGSRGANRGAVVRGAGQDPLTTGEAGSAERLAARSGLGAGSGPATGAAAPGRNVQGGPGAEVLYSERHHDAKGAGGDLQRRADVYLYDYGTDTLLRRVVNLTTGRVEQATAQRGVQLPPSAGEVSQAVRIILADPRLGPGLRAAYQSSTSHQLTAPSQLHTQGITFLASHSAGLAGADRVAQCGAHRCIQLFARIPGGKWVDTSRIVIDLSARRAVVVGQ
jgi:hypothetical protein